MRLYAMRALVACALFATHVSSARADDGFEGLVADARASGRDLSAALATDASTYEQRLVGLVVDGVERGDLDVVFDGTSYYLPVTELAGLIGATASPADGSLVFATPAGDARVPGGALYALDGRVFVNESAVRDALATPIRFDAARYALVLDLPWWQNAAGARGRREAPVPDRTPPAAALSGIRLDYQYIDSDAADQQLVDYRFDGSLADGGWRVNVEQEIDGDTAPDEYFWLRAYERGQVMAGYQQVLAHPLLPTTPFTGGQVLFSNRALDPLDTHGLVQSEFARSLARPQQDIRGTTQAGAIAELRVDGRVVARTRARLDGTYEFTGIDLPSRGHSDIEVLVFDRSYATLIDRIDHSRSSSELLLAGGHQVLLVGGGEAGNVLDDAEVDTADGAAGVVQWRRGLTDRITAEAALVEDGSTAYQQAGIVAALGARWVGALGAATDGAGMAYQSELAGFGTRWRLDYYGEERGDDYRDYGATSTHDLRYEYRYRPTLWLGVRGRYTDDTNDGSVGGEGTDEAFVLPGATWMPNARFDLRAWPNIDGDYRFDTRYRATPNTQSTYSYEAERHTFEWSYWRPSGVEYYTRFDHEPDIDARFETGARFSLESDFRSHFQAALVATADGKVGYLFSAEKTLYPGFYLSVEVRDEPYRGDIDAFDDAFGAYDEPDDTRIAQLRFTADLSVAGRRVVPADTLAIYRTTGAIAGSVDVDGAVDRMNFDGVTLLVDGHAHEVASRDGRFYVGDLRPGVYRVRLSQASLPIELMPADESYWVKVSQGAVTRVDFTATVRYGAAGRVVDAAGRPLADVDVRVVDRSGLTVADVRTDAFGLYRVDGLPPGPYRIEVDDAATVATREFEIADAFLFDVDVSLDGAATSAPSAAPPH